MVQPPSLMIWPPDRARIGTFNDGRQLRITDAGFDARGTHGARANAHFHDIGTGEDQLFTHFTGHHVARDDGFRPGFTRLADELHEVLGVTIRHINTNEVERRVSIQDLFGLLEIRIECTGETITCFTTSADADATNAFHSSGL
jgi:hypothetical protein